MRPSAVLMALDAIELSENDTSAVGKQFGPGVGNAPRNSVRGVIKDVGGAQLKKNVCVTCVTCNSMCCLTCYDMI
jgi:hypothetical protein